MLPYRRILSHPTLTMLIEQMHGELLHPGDDMDRVIEHVAIGAMHPRNVLERIGPGSLLILPGDRQDIISAAGLRQPHAAGAAASPGSLGLACAIGRTSGVSPATRRRSRWPASSSRAASGPASATSMPSARPGSSPTSLDDETYDVASEVHDLLVKTHPADTAKIEETKRLVTDHFDVDAPPRATRQRSDSTRARRREPAADASRSAGRSGRRLAGCAPRSNEAAPCRGPRESHAAAATTTAQLPELRVRTGGLVLEGHDGAGAAPVDAQLEDVRAAVVAGGVEVLAFLAHARYVHVSDDEALAPRDRLAQPAAVRAAMAEPPSAQSPSGSWSASGKSSGTSAA